MIFTFSILHYKTLQDTIECIESIKNLNYSCKIVVVDNGSNNGSFEKLKDIYKENDIIFIDNDKNLGFAAANNIGYKYAKEKLNSDFIAVINNDIIVKSKNIIEILIKKWKKDSYYIAGPNIIGLDGVSHQNPMDIIRYKKRQLLYKSFQHMVAFCLSKIGFYNLLNNYSESQASENNTWMDEKRNAQLQGSFIIYSSNYVNNEDFAFYPGTFLYMEEAILRYYARSHNYLIMYYPEIEIIHKGGVSTNASYKNAKKVYEMRLKNISRSMLVLRKVMKKYPMENYD